MSGKIEIAQRGDIGNVDQYALGSAFAADRFAQWVIVNGSHDHVVGVDFDRIFIYANVFALNPCDLMSVRVEPCRDGGVQFRRDDRDMGVGLEQKVKA